MVLLASVVLLCIGAAQPNHSKASSTNFEQLEPDHSSLTGAFISEGAVMMVAQDTNSKAHVTATDSSVMMVAQDTNSKAHVTATDSSLTGAFMLKSLCVVRACAQHKDYATAHSRGRSC